MLLKPITVFHSVAPSAESEARAEGTNRCSHRGLHATDPCCMQAAPRSATAACEAVWRGSFKIQLRLGVWDRQRYKTCFFLPRIVLPVTDTIMMASPRSYAWFDSLDRRFTCVHGT